MCKKDTGFKVRNMCKNVQGSKYETGSKMYRVQNAKQVKKCKGFKIWNMCKNVQISKYETCAQKYETCANMYRVQNMRHVQICTGYVSCDSFRVRTPLIKTLRCTFLESLFFVLMIYTTKAVVDVR